MGVEGSPLVVKAPSDQRQYEVVHLKNGLVALLIHDPLMFHAPEVASSGRGGEESAEDASSGVDEDEEEESGDECNEEENGEMPMDCDENCTDHHHHHGSSGADHEDEGEDEQSDDEFRGPRKKLSGMAPTKKAAAAMCVGVGSFSDPPDAEGLAHFLEHMLFMGSTKFPDENEYDDFLSKHGGASNAFTETEYTCYHFEVNDMHLKPALDRFSQFFISPLAKAEAMDREVQSIDSEFEQVQQSDACRLLQLQCHTAHPEHPFHSFSWGNKVSLGLPMANGVDMRSKLLELYKNHYWAGLMKLVVLGGEPLETLREWVTELFEEVRSGEVEKPSFPWTGSVWEKGRSYRLESVKDQHHLSLMWLLPCLHTSYLKKPQDYISHLVGHEGTGSLLSLLKQKGWATALSAGVGDSGYQRSSAGYVFNVTIDLTVAGLDKLLDVVGLFYQYVKMLRTHGPQDWVFKELQAMGSMEFKFAEEESADSYVVRLASNMHLFPEEHIIYGDYAFEEWDPKLVTELLAKITPDNMRLDVLSKQFDDNSPDLQLEPWFEARYIVDIIPQDVLQIWKDPPQVDLSLHMPMVNEFIPHDFSIRIPEGGDSTDVPLLLLDSSSVKLWYKLDKTFKTPRANVFLSTSLGAASKTLKAEVLTELYVKILADALNEILYSANVARLESSISVSGEKIELKLFGFNEKLHVLAFKISELFRTCVIREDRFQAMKEDLERVYRNSNMKPLKQAAYTRLQVLKERFWHVDDKLSCLHSLSLEDLTGFIPLLFEQSYMEGFCHGNLSREEAVNIVNIFKEAFFSSALPPELRYTEKIYKLPECTHVLQAQAKNLSEENSVIEMYFQAEPDLGLPSLRTRVLLDLLEEIISEPCFNQLRTKEQLGYQVDCGVRVTHRVLGFCFRIQSSKHSPSFLQHRLNVFISSIQHILESMKDEEFVGYKEALIAEKLERDHSLIDETNRLWEQILDQRYIFDANKLEALEVPNIRKTDLLEWVSNHLMADGPFQRKLCIQIWGNKTPEERSDLSEYTEKYEEILDLVSFKSNLKVFPNST